MKLLLFLFGAALAAGLYFVLADLLKIPRLATERALISAGRKERSLVKSMETLVLGWSLKLAPLIRLDAYKRRRLETKLTAAGLDMTPEVFTAYTVLKPCLILLGVIPCLLILPILTPLVVVLALLTYFKESRRADELCKARIYHLRLERGAEQQCSQFRPEQGLYRRGGDSLGGAGTLSWKPFARG